VAWPGAQQRSVAFAQFEDSVAAPERIVLGGPWAWFRLIDAANAEAAQARSEADLVTTLSIRTSHHRALVTIAASNASSNPFAAREWRQFTCEP
jgi:type VI protein secretion system component VasK